MSVDGVDKEDIVISVQVPDGAEPGDSLSFEANGQNFTIEVPIASVAGEILQIKLANSVDEKDFAIENSNGRVENEIDSGKFTKEMITGSKISILQATQTVISGKNISDETYQLLWPASLYIVKFINTPEFCSKFVRSQVYSVIELGAGHGMLGMAFADVASNFVATDTTMKLVLTDVEEALPQLEANIQINRDVFEKRVDIATLPLKWHRLPIPHTNSKFDFILGSDILYNCSIIPDLVATIRRLVCKSSKILLSVRWRKPLEERSFFTTLSDIIDWKLVYGDCVLDHCSYGNGSFESNKFFSQSMVSIGDKVVPLSSIDEKGCEEMNTKEFEQFEELQTQIYFGQVREKRLDMSHVKKRPKLDIR